MVSKSRAGLTDISAAFTVMPWKKEAQSHTTGRGWVELTHAELISVFSSTRESDQDRPSVKVFLSGRLTPDPDTAMPHYQGSSWHLDFQEERVGLEAFS